MSDLPYDGDDDFSETQSYSLVMPFVVCTSVGGPYDDESFVAGVKYGIWESILKLQPTMHSNYENPKLVKQLDLLAMKEGYILTVESIDNGYVDEDTEWVLVTMKRGI